MTSRAEKLVLMATVLCLLLLLELMAQATEGSRSQGRVRNRNRSNTTTNGAGSGRERQGGNDAQCETIEVPMCKGLVGYTRTKLPNRFNHTTQLQIYRVLEHMWTRIDRGCSQNFRLLACSFYLPKCAGGRRPAQEPCAATCTHTKRVCEARLHQDHYTWPEQLDCDVLPKKNCLRKIPDKTCDQNHTLCAPLDLPLCQSLGLRYSTGMSPNMFGQCHRAEVSAEMEQFRPLVASGCSPRLGLFLCAAYMPFCAGPEAAMAQPCRELCLEVRDACSGPYRTLSGGLPWPNKFQCHRYPESTDRNFACVMSNEEDGLFNAAGTAPGVTTA